MSDFLKEPKKHNATKGYRMPDQSLEAHVFRLAYTEGRTVMARFPTEEQIEAANTRFWVDSVENGEMVPDGPPVDVLAVLRLYADMLKEAAFRELEEGFASQPPSTNVGTRSFGITTMMSSLKSYLHTLPTCINLLDQIEPSTLNNFNHFLGMILMI